MKNIMKLVGFFLFFVIFNSFSNDNNNNINNNKIRSNNNNNNGIIYNSFFYVQGHTFSGEPDEEDKAHALKYPKHGVDISLPIHHPAKEIYTKSNGLIDSVPAKRWERLMQGCGEKYGRARCESSDAARLRLNLNQPPRQHNYTEAGYTKLTLPKDIFDDILQYWNWNKDKEIKEAWPAANTYVNHWEQDSYMVSLENRQMRGDGYKLKDRIWAHVQPILETWINRKVKATSLYGIRVYKKGAVLASHVDRIPLVTSCIIQVAQDPRMERGEVESWPVEVYDHQGMGHNITMKPGDMVLYESHSVIHGRPTPLEGSFYANIFVHFEPIDDEDRGDSGQYGSLNYKYKQNVKMTKGGHEHDSDLEYDLVQTPLHQAAGAGELELVKRLVELKPEHINKPDDNKWHPIHEATRAGHTDIVEVLVNAGADVHVKTNSGGTPRWWAKKYHGEKHALYEYFKNINAPEEL